MKKLFLLAFGCLTLFLFFSNAYAEELKVGRIVVTYNDDLQKLHNGFMDRLETKYKYKLNWNKEAFHKTYPFEKGMDEVIRVTDALTQADPFFYNANMKGPADAADFEKRVMDKAKEMIGKGVDIIYCEGTSEQVLKATEGTKTIVIDGTFFASDEAIAKGLYIRKPDGQLYSTRNATGTMFYYPVDAICDFIRDLKPGARVAYFYNDKSYISRSPKDIQDAAAKRGLTVKSYVFYTPEEVAAGLEKAKTETDFAFFTNDLFVVGGHVAALEFSNKNNYPIITAIVPLVNEGALAGMQCSLYNAGELSADKAVQVIKGTKASDIPISISTEQNLGLNLVKASKLGYQIPFEWIQIASIVVEK